MERAGEDDITGTQRGEAINSSSPSGTEMPVIDSHSRPALFRRLPIARARINAKSAVLKQRDVQRLGKRRNPVRPSVIIQQLPGVFELFLTSSNNQERERRGGGDQGRKEAGARRLNVSLFRVQNLGIVSWHGGEVLMTMGHPGCEVIERKPSLAEAGRVLVSS